MHANPAARRRRAAAFLVVGLTCSLASIGHAQVMPAPVPAAPHGSAPGDGGTFVPCSALSDPRFAGAVDEAWRTLERLWLKTRNGLFIAYTMEATKRNPFDLSPKSPRDEAPISGMIQARLPECSAQPIANALLVRFTTPFYRFYDPTTGWSRPLRDGLVMEVAIRQVGAGWEGRDTRTEAGILLHDESVHQPAERDVPKLKRWAEPLPKCARHERWNGTDCAGRRR
jgi:hypothetical protein